LNFLSFAEFGSDSHQWQWQACEAALNAAHVDLLCDHLGSDNSAAASTATEIIHRAPVVNYRTSPTAITSIECRRLSGTRSTSNAAPVGSSSFYCAELSYRRPLQITDSLVEDHPHFICLVARSFPDSCVITRRSRTNGVSRAGLNAGELRELDCGSIHIIRDSFLSTTLSRAAFLYNTPSSAPAWRRLQLSSAQAVGDNLSFSQCLLRSVPSSDGTRCWLTRMFPSHSPGPVEPLIKWKLTISCILTMKFIRINSNQVYSTVEKRCIFLPTR
jgi:hypothetical protein